MTYEDPRGITINIQKSALQEKSKLNCKTQFFFCFFWWRTLLSALALCSLDNTMGFFLGSSEYRGGITDVTPDSDIA